MAKTPRKLAYLIALSALSSTASGYSLAGSPTDASVCDLAPHTISRLGRTPFVQAGTRDEEVIYERLALRKIASNCLNGQTLILDSEDGDAFDDRVFRNVSQQLCVVSDVRRIATAKADQPGAFQIRCAIQKLDQARAWLTEAEQKISTEQMIQDGAPKRSANTPPPNAAVKKDCSKLNLSTMLNGGGAECQ